MHCVCELCGNYGCSCWDDRRANYMVKSGWVATDMIYAVDELPPSRVRKIRCAQHLQQVMSKGAITRGRFPEAYFEGWTTHKAAPANKIETELLNLVDAEAHQVTLG